MTRRHTHTTSLSGSRDGVDWEIEVRATYTYRPATADHYDPAIGGPGGWSPGDPAELDIIEIEIGIGADKWVKETDPRQFESLRDRLIDERSDRLIEQAESDDDGEHYDYLRQRMKDERWEDGR